MIRLNLLGDAFWTMAAPTFASGSDLSWRWWLLVRVWRPMVPSQSPVAIMVGGRLLPFENLMLEVR